MNREQYTDQQIVVAIQNGGEERNAVLNFLFTHSEFRETVKDTVLKAGGNDHYSQFVFENCLVQLDKIVRRRQYKSQNLVDFFDAEARTAWCRELILNQSARETVLQHLTDDDELKGKIRAAVVKNSGSDEDAKDMYQNGLMLIDDHMKEGKFRGGAVKGFFYQVCYNLWRNELKRHKAIPLPEDGFDLSVTMLDPQVELERKERVELLRQIFDELGDTCKKIIRLKFFVIDNFSMEEIAEQMGYKNAQIAANALSKCRKILRDLLSQHKHSFEWIPTI